jgi:regulator of RNase E activity RraA
LYSGVISDVLDFDLPGAGEHIFNGRWPFTRINSGCICGPEFACYGELVTKPSQIKDNIRIDMLKDIEHGMVQVVYSPPSAQKDIAIYGDISALLAQQAGAIGAVICGPTRDADIIATMDFPVWHRGVAPRDAYGRWQIGSYRVTGDYIFADGDAVFKIYGKYIHRVLVLAQKRVASEAEIRAELFKGVDPGKLYEDKGRW